MDASELKAISEAVAASLAARTAPPGPAIMPLGSMVQAPPTAPTGGVTLSVALEVPLSDGSTASVHMALPPGSESNLVGAIEGLLRSGWPIRCYRPRQAWGQNAGWGNRGSYGRSWR